MKKNEDWKNFEIFGFLSAAFLITQLLGMFVTSTLISLNVKSTILTEDINDPINAIYLFFMILLMTGIILLILKFRKKSNFLWIIEMISVFFTGLIVFGSFFPNNDLIALILTAIVFSLRYTKKENLWIKNLVSVIAISGAGALLGVSIGVLPVLMFIFILAIYDLVAVFKTKHMITLGQAVVKRNFAFTISMPTKKHKFELGNGDLIIPLVTSSSIIANGFFINNYFAASLILISSFIGLILTIYIVATKKVALPALPLQVLFMLIMFFTLVFFGI
jgi:presenilin-like A22 family membrane protease